LDPQYAFPFGGGEGGRCNNTVVNFGAEINFLSLYPAKAPNLKTEYIIIYWWSGLVHISESWINE
jgi:hypothetical protein